jgi:hypothetical protein
MQTASRPNAFSLNTEIHVRLASTSTSNLTKTKKTVHFLPFHEYRSFSDKIAAMQMPTDHVQRCQLWLESSVTGLYLLRFEYSASIIM